MKKIFPLLIMASLVACSSSNDEGAPSDPTDDMSGGDGGSVAITVDFDVAIMARDDDFNYYQIEIEDGSTLLAAEEILLSIEDNSSFYQRLENDTYLAYSPFNYPDYKVGRHNILNGADNTYVDFIDPNLPEVGHDIFPGRDHIVTFYSLPDGNNSLNQYFNLYTIATGNYEQVLITDEELALVRHIQNGWLTTSYIDSQSQFYLRFHNLNNTNQQYTIGPVNNFLTSTQNNAKLYLFGNNDYRILDLTTGVLGSAITTAQSIWAQSVFRSQFVGDKMYYDQLLVQPSAFRSAPAIFNFSTGTSTIFDIGQFKADWWISSGNQILNDGLAVTQSSDEIIVLAFSFRNANNVDKFGVLFVTYDAEVISFLEIPHRPLEVIIK